MKQLVLRANSTHPGWVIIGGQMPRVVLSPQSHRASPLKGRLSFFLYFSSSLPTNVLLIFNQEYVPSVHRE